jgi:pyruvate dehydrogenase E2 component (dihydrolipoamide acetyltransferase)
VRHLATELGVDLSTIRGTGADGAITRDDVRGAVAGDSADVTGETRTPIRGVRKATAEAMVASAFTAPHVTEFLTVDVTPSLELLERLRARPEFADARPTMLA